ncbi:MAG: hypothetical protein F6J92_38965 [Symploca sp. SIO1A3]|nr:hypothetical protein [Symploca sp. SIO1A3]
MPLSSVRPNIQPVWFDDIQHSLAITPSEGKAIANFVAAVISLDSQTEAKLPTTLREDNLPRIVFLSVSDSHTPAQVALGAGIGVKIALEQAIANLQARLSTEYQPRWLKIDIVQDVVALERLNSVYPLRQERSLYGLAFEQQSGIAFLPEELLAYTLLNQEQRLQPKNITKYLNSRPLQAQEYQRLQNAQRLRIYRFRSTSLFTDGKEVVGMYRGHRLFSRIESEELLTAAVAGGQYLSRALSSEGKFVYNYRPKKDEVPDKYNILRHAGTIYAMLELYEVTRETELLQGAQRGINYLLPLIQPYPTALDNASCVVEKGYIKLGGNALAAIALAKYIELTNDQQYLPIILSLGRWIQTVQSKTGKFLVHKQSYPEGIVSEFVSDYYPGEAILAMMRIYTLDSKATWLDAAEAAAKYLIKVRDGNLRDSQLTQDHWLLYGLNELYRHRANPLYLNHALRLANSIIQSQNCRPQELDWQGSFSQPPRSTPTATRMEGLYAAYQLAKDFGHQEEAQAIFEAMQLGVAFQLQTQYRAESVMYLPNPQRALGGFHRSLTNFEIRIDYVQHNISSILGLFTELKFGISPNR